MEYQEFVYRNRWPIVILLLGIILFCFGFYFYYGSSADEEVFVVESMEDNTENSQTIIVEISGAVAKPGVYKLSSNSRIEDLLKEAGGFYNENKDWVERFINRASKLVDGQKVYIPAQNEQTDSLSANNLQGSIDSATGVLGVGSSLININTASQTQLESLWGIGPVYAKSIIDQRPYSDVSELTSKKIIKQNVFEKIKNQISVY